MNMNQAEKPEEQPEEQPDSQDSELEESHDKQSESDAHSSQKDSETQDSEKNNTSGKNTLPSFMTSPYFIGIAFGLFYGLVNRMIVFNPKVSISENDFFSNIFIITTFGFVFLIPFVMGYLSLATRKQPFKNSIEQFLTAIFMPWIPTFLSLVAAVLTGFEAMVCIIMATPVFLVMSSIGGLVGSTAITTNKKLNQFILAGIMVLPHSVSALESRIPLHQSIEQVDNTIIINADIATVWQNIESVPLIQEQEQSTSFLHSIGFPRPLEATLSHKGVGGVRHASFEDNVLFVETVTEWDYHKSLAFTIKPRVEKSTSEFLNTKILGGRYFNVLNGRYQIEPLKSGQIKLHLSSQHQIATHYNFYAALWTRYIMSDLQQYILKIIKKRCET